VTNVNGTILGDCAWCGAEIESKPKPAPRSRRGELFCCVAHRDASARAVRRLRKSQGDL
jgi:hypothetical protein